MPSPQRKPRPYRGDLTADSLDRLTWAQLCNLAASGVISWADVNAVLKRKGSTWDPYQHLRGGPLT